MVEPMPDVVEGTIAGFPIADVMALDWQSGGIWDDAELKAALRRIGRRDLVQVQG